MLEGSVRLYIDHLNGKLGQKDIDKQKVERLAKAVNLEVTSNYYCVLQQSLSDPQLQSNERMLRDYDSFAAAIQVLLREIEKAIPYANEDNCAYDLKWMLRNCPPWRERSTWIDNCANVDPFLSGYFSYCGVRYLKLSGDLSGLRMEIHMRCSVEGIKYGPYILLNPDEADRLFGKEELESIGLVRDQWYRYPFDLFSMEKTPLLDVALHIKRMVDGLKDLPSVGINHPV